MKRTALIIAIILAILPVITADVLPPNNHPVDRVVMVNNCSGFPEIRLVGYITGPMIQGYELIGILDDTIINKGYKFNTFGLYALHTSAIEAAGGLDRIDFSRIAAVSAPVPMIDPGTYFVPDSNPLVKETIVYTIVGMEDNNLVLYISRRTLEYNNGDPATVETYLYTPDKE